MVQSFWKIVWQFFTQVNIVFPYYSAVALLGVYPKELTTCPHKNMNMDVYRVLFIIAKMRKQTTCPSAAG